MPHTRPCRLPKPSPALPRTESPAGPLAPGACATGVLETSSHFPNLTQGITEPTKGQTGCERAAELLSERFSTGIGLGPQGTFGNLWRHFWLSQRGRETGAEGISWVEAHHPTSYRPPGQNNYFTQNVNSHEAEKHCFRITRDSDSDCLYPSQGSWTVMANCSQGQTQIAEHHGHHNC